MKKRINKKRNQMRAYPHDKIRGRLLRKGWEASTIEGTMQVGDQQVPIEAEVYSHETLGKELRLEDANIAQKRHEDHLKETYDERIAKYLLDNGWVLTDSGSWYKPNWNSHYNNKPAWNSRDEDDEENQKEPIVTKGCYATLRQAYRIQLKLDSSPKVDGLEESLEDLMIMAHSDFGA